MKNLCGVISVLSLKLPESQRCHAVSPAPQPPCRAIQRLKTKLYANGSWMPAEAVGFSLNYWVRGWPRCFCLWRKGMAERALRALTTGRYCDLHTVCMRLDVAASICIASVRGSCEDTGGDFRWKRDWLGVLQVRILWRGRELGWSLTVNCIFLFPGTI